MVRPPIARWRISWQRMDRTRRPDCRRWGRGGGGRRRYLPLGPQALSSQRAQPRTRRVSIESKIWCAVARRLRRWATTSLETPTFTVHLAYVLSQHDDLSTDLPHLFAGTERLTE